jgi:hypothetical protein
MPTETEIRIKTAALRHFCPSGFTTSEDMDTFRCVSESTPSKSDVDAKVVELTAEYDSLAWERSRQGQRGYPSVGDQLDMLMKDMRDGTTTHKDACEAVKAKFPKP